MMLIDHERASERMRHGELPGKIGKVWREAGNNILFGRNCFFSLRIFSLVSETVSGLDINNG